MFIEENLGILLYVQNVNMLLYKFISVLMFMLVKLLYCVTGASSSTCNVICNVERIFDNIILRMAVMCFQAVFAVCDISLVILARVLKQLSYCYSFCVCNPEILTQSFHVLAYEIIF